MKKVGYAAVMMAILLLTACKAEGNAQESMETGVSSKTEVKSTKETGTEPVRLKFFCFSGVPKEVEYFKQAVAEFEKDNPGVTFDVEYLPHNDLVTKVNVAYASGSYPDLIYSPIGELITWTAKGQIAPIDSYLDEWGARENVVENRLDMASYKDQVYGLGIRSNCRFLAYRKDLFEEAGLDPEKPPKTWEELEDYAQKLTKRDKNGVITQVGFDMFSQGNESAFQWEGFVKQNGGEICNPDTDELLINNPKAIEALQFLSELYSKDICPPMNGNTAAEWPFMKGYSAMANISVDHYNTLISNFPELKGKVGFTVSTERESKGCIGGLITLAIGSESKHKDECAAFMKYLLSDEENQKRVDQIGCPPIVKSMKESYIKQNLELNSVILEAIEYSVTRPRTTWSSVYTTQEALMFESVLIGGVDPKEAVANLEEAVQKEIDRAK